MLLLVIVDKCIVLSPNVEVTCEMKQLKFISYCKVHLSDIGRIHPGHCNNGSIQLIAVFQCRPFPAADPLFTSNAYSSVDDGTADVLANLLAFVHPVPVILGSKNTRL